jgi:hypothetical protein
MQGVQEFPERGEHRLDEAGLLGLGVGLVGDLDLELEAATAAAISSGLLPSRAAACGWSMAAARAASSASACAAMRRLSSGISRPSTRVARECLALQAVRQSLRGSARHRGGGGQRGIGAAPEVVQRRAPQRLGPVVGAVVQGVEQPGVAEQGVHGIS